jgi:hypothetical protein
MVDTVFRKYEIPARQAVQRFGIENVGTFIQRTYEKKPDESVEILHAVMPRADRDPTKKDNKNMPYSSMYICMETKMISSREWLSRITLRCSSLLKGNRRSDGSISSHDCIA